MPDDQNLETRNLDNDGTANGTSKSDVSGKMMQLYTCWNCGAAVWVDTKKGPPYVCEFCSSTIEMPR